MISAFWWRSQSIAHSSTSLVLILCIELVSRGDNKVDGAHYCGRYREEFLAEHIGSLYVRLLYSLALGMGRALRVRFNQPLPSYR
jgi:hypothetical protein